MLTKSEWPCPLPSCKVHAQGSGVPEGRGKWLHCCCIQEQLRDWGWDFPPLPSSMLRGKLQLILIFPKLNTLSARDTEPAQARLGLLAEVQLRQTPLDTFQGQLGSGGSTAPRTELWPRNLAGQGQLRREPARTPSVPSRGAEGSGQHRAEDTSMASDGQLRSLKAQVLAPDALLGCPGTRSTMQRCSGGSARARRALLSPAKN